MHTIGTRRASRRNGRGIRRAGLALVAWSLALVAGCVDVREPPLRIGINPWPGYAFAFLARDLGYFEQAGLEVRLLEFSSLSDVRRAFERGQLDGYFGTPVETLLAHARAPHLPRITAVVDISHGGDVILARPGFGRVADLRGRRIALEPDSVNVYVLAAALESAGLRLAEVTLVPSPQQDLDKLFAAGAIDAAVTYAPFRQQLEAHFELRPVFDSSELPQGIPDVLMFSPRTPPRRVAAFTQAYWRAVDFHARDPERTHLRMARALGIPRAELGAHLAHDVRIYQAADQPALLSDPHFLPRVLARSAETLLAIGEITRRYTAGEIRALIGTPPALADAAR